MSRKKAAGSDEPGAETESLTTDEAGSAEPGKKKTIRQYWIALLTKHPSWLHERSNDRLFEEYLKDHPDVSAVPQNAKQGLSTVKSMMRKERKERKRGRRAEGENGAAAPASPGRPRGRGVAALEHLEERIDDVLALARTTDGVEGTHVVQSLKAARNAVIVLLHKG